MEPEKEYLKQLSGGVTDSHRSFGVPFTTVFEEALNVLLKQKYKYMDILNHLFNSVLFVKVENLQ